MGAGQQGKQQSGRRDEEALAFDGNTRGAQRELDDDDGSGVAPRDFLGQRHPRHGKGRDDDDCCDHKSMMPWRMPSVTASTRLVTSSFW